MEIVCPSCGERDALEGEQHDGSIAMSCGACHHRWERDLTKRCRTCGSLDIQTVPLAIIEKGRGTQLSVVGTRPIDLCSICDAARLRAYHDRRPNPLMPDDLPTVDPNS